MAPACNDFILSLQDPEFHVRAFVADALGNIGNKEAIPALEKALANKDENKYVKGFIREALEKIREGN